MCGRYVFAVRPSEIRRQFEEAGMPSEEAPDDDEVRHTYNFAPGSFGVVYRADVPDYGARREHPQNEEEGVEVKSPKKEHPQVEEVVVDKEPRRTKYKLQAMKWGLVPSWTKRSPDYGTILRTINTRDDSLIENRGMWTSMKKGKRCIVVCQGFYEWIKKNNGKDKIPYYVKRKDGQLMCFAGLWDCVKYEGSEEKHYTYSIITTDPNEQLKFLHDRMPVIFDNGSEDIRTWLDPARNEWSKELQSLLRPYEGELECYQVTKEVGKVGNNSPSFIVPINSAQNKNNIANFFGSQKKTAKEPKQESESDDDAKDKKDVGIKLKQEEDELRDATSAEVPEGREPSRSASDEQDRKVLKRERATSGDEGDISGVPPAKAQKIDGKVTNTIHPHLSPSKSASKAAGKTRSATSNGTIPKTSPSKTSPSKGKGGGSHKITAFFSK